MNAPGQLGRYTLLRRLAAGGMGEVYLAEASGAAHFTHKVAIKRILPHLAEDQVFHNFRNSVVINIQFSQISQIRQWTDIS